MNPSRSTDRKQILIVSDGNPGHYSKSRAIARMVSNRAPADVNWLNVRMRLGLYRSCLRFFLNHTNRVPSPRLLRMFYRIAEPIPERPDLIIGSGGKTTFVCAWLGAWHQSPVVFVGQVRGVAERYFAHLVSTEFVSDDGRIRIEQVPVTEIDQELADISAATYLSESSLPSRHRWTLVVGGNGGGYTYSQTDWKALRDAACRIADDYGIRWMVTTSRRTPRIAEEILAGDAMRQRSDEIVIFNSDRRPLYNALLGCGDVIVCTEDSGQMIAETVASGRPVVLVRPPVAQTSHLCQSLIQGFEQSGYVRRLTIDQLGTESIEDFLRDYRSPPQPIMQHIRDQVDDFVTNLEWGV